MTSFKLNYETVKSGILPPISLSLHESYTTAIYSDTDMQAELIDTLLHNGEITVFNRKEGLYDRLTVMDNVTFYHKWFGCSIPLPEILVMFELQMCAKKRLRKCSQSEIARVYYAKYFMMDTHPMVFQEPIHGVDIKTINTFINMLKKITDNKTPALILVSNIEHALLLSDVAYKLQEKGLQKLEVDTGEKDKSIPEAESAATLSTAKLFKIPAKIDDKVILFDPMEIDYIESQEGKAMIVINHESFSLDSTLAEIEKKLEVYGFYRCHRSYIVNLQKVREIITWSKNIYSLRVDNQVKSTIPLSRTKIQGIQDMFNLK
ncbi:ABC transporter ATP-binding protein [Gracilibacillus salitolerans]|uniref:ABC transporter ATP-binding protein n=1 Tax=Gracilibacillus salitolerans TaxID=2663022 RepID=A0A5Q2TT34_9BACI|nr:LytTR family transcriptional regulator DNA-binding domain-containing protein [Gracilibacillus salitolerans]QGH36820.1 ABC transporter ATP-binding protein [Gracilibacillus salitolerans]